MLAIRFWNSANARPDGDVITFTGDWVQFDNDCVEVGHSPSGDSSIVAHYDKAKGRFFHILSADESTTAQNFVVESV